LGRGFSAENTVKGVIPEIQPHRWNALKRLSWPDRCYRGRRKYKNNQKPPCCRDAVERKLRTRNQRGSVFFSRRHNSTKKSNGVCLRLQEGCHFQCHPQLILDPSRAGTFLIVTDTRPGPRSTFSFEWRGRGGSMRGTESRVNE